MVVKAKEMREGGMKQEAIAVELGLSQGAVSRILRQGLGERRPRGRRPSRPVQA